MEELEDNDAPVWRFVLERAIHEFNNRVGGILSVSEAHLARRIDNRELKESLLLIRDGAKAASEFVVTLADLLAAEDTGPEMTRLSDLREYLLAKIRLFLPRHIKINTPDYADDTVVRVNAKRLLFNLLALLQHELSEEPASFLLELALKAEGRIGWLIYHSTGRVVGSDQAEFCKTVFVKMRPSLSGLQIREEPCEFEVAIGFPAGMAASSSEARSNGR
jgi:hypothetical protein